MKATKTKLLVAALLSVCSLATAQTTYNFTGAATTGYAYGSNPAGISCTDVSNTSAGYWKIATSPSNANINVLNVGAYTVNGSSAIITGDLTQFPVSTNYAVRLKKIPNSAKLTKWGLVLRAQSTSKNYPGTATTAGYSNLKDGLLFQITESATGATLQLRKAASSTSFTNIGSSAAIAYDAANPVWYKAEAIGSDYKFYWSTDSVSWTQALSATDTNFPSGSTQIWSGLGNPQTDIQVQYITHEPLTVTPVNLSLFKAVVNQSNVVLNWQTSYELKNAGFDVERSQDGTDFKKIGFVAASGAGSGVENYTFRDESFLPGKIYYRLKQIDNNGSFEYSDVVGLSTIIPVSGVKIYPNPTKDILNIPAIDKTCTITIYNTTGQVILNKQLVKNELNRINVSNLSSGVFIYEIQGVRGTFIKE